MKEWFKILIGVGRFKITSKKNAFRANSGKQDFHYDTKELSQPIRKTFKEAGQKWLWKSEATIAAIENVVGNFPGTNITMANIRKAFSFLLKTK